MILLFQTGKTLGICQIWEKAGVSQGICLVQESFDTTVLPTYMDIKVKEINSLPKNQGSFW